MMGASNRGNENPVEMIDSDTERRKMDSWTTKGMVEIVALENRLRLSAKPWSVSITSAVPIPDYLASEKSGMLVVCVTPSSGQMTCWNNWGRKEETRIGKFESCFRDHWFGRSKDCNRGEMTGVPKGKDDSLYLWVCNTWSRASWFDMPIQTGLKRGTLLFCRWKVERKHQMTSPAENSCNRRSQDSW